jgi:hypothetical protein
MTVNHHLAQIATIRTQERFDTAKTLSVNSPPPITALRKFAAWM